MDKEKILSTWWDSKGQYGNQLLTSIGFMFWIKTKRFTNQSEFDVIWAFDKTVWCDIDIGDTCC